MFDHDPISHAVLIDLIQAVSIPIDSEEGVCNGTVCMDLWALLVQDTDCLITRRQLLGELTTGVDINELGRALKETGRELETKAHLLAQLKERGVWPKIVAYVMDYLKDADACNQTDAHLWDIFRSDILAYLTGISINQTPWSHEDVLEQSVQRAETSMSFTRPTKGVDMQYLGVSSGVYSREELVDYFQCLNQWVSRLQEPMGFLLSGHYHAIFLGYDPVMGWMLDDVNSASRLFRPIASAGDFADQVRGSFAVGQKDSENDHACFSTKYYTNEGTILTLRSLTQTRTWQEIHRCTPVKAQDSRNWLHCALRAQDLEAVRQLLACGADPNAPDNRHATPLLLAVAAGNLELIKILSDGGADPRLDDLTMDNAINMSNAAVIDALLVAQARHMAREAPGVSSVQDAYIRILRCADLSDDLKDSLREYLMSQKDTHLLGYSNEVESFSLVRFFGCTRRQSSDALPPMLQEACALLQPIIEKNDSLEYDIFK